MLIMQLLGLSPAYGINVLALIDIVLVYFV